jgi:hypothetical protein
MSHISKFKAADADADDVLLVLLVPLILLVLDWVEAHDFRTSFIGDETSSVTRHRR